MEKFTILTWVRKWGLRGLVAFAVLVVLKLFFEAVFEQIAQDYWISNVKPFLLSFIEVRFKIYGWLLVLLMALVLIAIGSVVYLRVRYPIR